MHDDILVPLIIFGFIGYIVKVISDNRIRRLLIDKGEINENLKYLYSDKLAFATPGSLKWGMVLIALGLSFLMSEIFSFLDDETGMFASMFIMGGLALVVYYFIATRMLKKQESEQTS